MKELVLIIYINRNMATVECCIYAILQKYIRKWRLRDYNASVRISSNAMTRTIAYLRGLVNQNRFNKWMAKTVCSEILEVSVRRCTDRRIAKICAIYLIKHFNLSRSELLFDRY